MWSCGHVANFSFSMRGITIGYVLLFYWQILYFPSNIILKKSNFGEASLNGNFSKFHKGEKDRI